MQLKVDLYNIDDVSPWPLASSIGALLLTSGFACYIHNISMIYKKNINEFVLDFVLSLNLFVRKIYVRRSYCIISKKNRSKYEHESKNDNNISYYKIKKELWNTFWKHLTMDQFVKEKNKGDIYYAKINITTSEKSKGELLFDRGIVHQKAVYLYNGEGELFIYPMKTMEDWKTVDYLIKQQKEDLDYTNKLNRDINAKQKVQLDFINKVKNRKKNGGWNFG